MFRVTILQHKGAMNINQGVVRENIARMVRECPLKQAEIAERAHLNSATISNWTSGRQKPSYGGLYALAHGLGCTVDELLYPPGAKEPERLDGLTIEQWRLRALRAEEERLHAENKLTELQIAVDAAAKRAH